MSRSMILRIAANGSPVEPEHEVFIMMSGKNNWISDSNLTSKKDDSEPTLGLTAKPNYSLCKS